MITCVRWSQSLPPHVTLPCPDAQISRRSYSKFKRYPASLTEATAAPRTESTLHSCGASTAPRKTTSSARVLLAGVTASNRRPQYSCRYQNPPKIVIHEEEVPCQQSSQELCTPSIVRYPSGNPTPRLILVRCITDTPHLQRKCITHPDSRDSHCRPVPTSMIIPRRGSTARHRIDNN